MAKHTQGKAAASKNTAQEDETTIPKTESKKRKAVTASINFELHGEQDEEDPTLVREAHLKGKVEGERRDLVKLIVHSMEKENAIAEMFTEAVDIYKTSRVAENIKEYIRNIKGIKDIIKELFED